MSLRTRLVLLVLGLVTVLLGGFGLFLSGRLEGWSSEALDRELEHRADLLAASVRLEDGELELDDDGGALAELGWPYRVETLEGTVLSASGSWPELQPAPGPADGLETLQARGRPVRVLSRTFRPRHGDEGDHREHRRERHHRPRDEEEAGGPLRLRVAAPATAFAPLLARFRPGLMLALGLALALGALGTAAIAQLFLAPVRRLSGQVAQVEASSLHTRLDVQGLDPELGRLAEAFNGLLARLGQAFEGQRAFVARASHALRTPLTSILTQAEVALRRERGAEEYRATLEQIAEAARHAGTLATGLLALERADAAARAAHPERLEVGPLFEELARLFRPRLEEAGLELTVAAGPGLAVEADRGRLRELLDALLDNAVRYTPRGGRVVLEGRAEGGRALLEVRDSGPGFAPGELEQVLEPFFRGRAAASVDGSGLGLSVARALAKAEGGTLELGAAPEGGARVRVALALAP